MSLDELRRELAAIAQEATDAEELLGALAVLLEGVTVAPHAEAA